MYYWKSGYPFKRLDFRVRFLFSFSFSFSFCVFRFGVFIFGNRSQVFTCKLFTNNSTMLGWPKGFYFGQNGWGRGSGRRLLPAVLAFVLFGWSCLHSPNARVAKRMNETRGVQSSFDYNGTGKKQKKIVCCVHVRHFKHVPLFESFPRLLSQKKKTKKKQRRRLNLKQQQIEDRKQTC